MSVVQTEYGDMKPASCGQARDFVDVKLGGLRRDKREIGHVRDFVRGLAPDDPVISCLEARLTDLEEEYQMWSKVKVILVSCL